MSEKSPVNISMSLKKISSLDLQNNQY